MLFSTKDQIRNASWFDWVTAISDTIIEEYQKRANWIVLWYVAWVYNIQEFTVERMTDSQAYELLSQSEILIATWYLLTKEYWSQWLQEDNQGLDKINEWKSILMQLYANPPIRLYDKNWIEFLNTPTGNSEAWNIKSCLRKKPLYKISDLW